VDAQDATEQRYIGAAAPNVCHLGSVEDIDFVSQGRQGRFGALL
jgi:hypothetical protein